MKPVTNSVCTLSNGEELFYRKYGDSPPVVL